MTNTVKRFLKKTVALAGVVLCASSGFALQPDGEESLIFSEDFEGETMIFSPSVVGSFPNAPGVKAEMGTDGSRAYGFGRSSCGSTAHRNYMSTLTLNLGHAYAVTRIEFDEIERYGNWGAQGELQLDGVAVSGAIFGREPSNDHQADTGFRHRSFSIDGIFWTLALNCWDITTDSEIFIDNVKIYGRALDVSGPEARIGTTEYATLADAVDAATDGSTIVLLRDIYHYGYLNVSEKSLVLDGDGHMVYGNNLNSFIYFFMEPSSDNPRQSIVLRNLTVVNDYTGSGGTPSAIFGSGNCDFVFTNCTFQSVHPSLGYAVMMGNAINPLRGSLTARDCSFISGGAGVGVSNVGCITNRLTDCSVQAVTAFTSFDNETCVTEVDGPATRIEPRSALASSSSGTLNLILKGGTYTKNPFSYVAPGYGFVDNGNSTWTVFKYPDDASAYTGQTTAGSYTISIPEQLDLLSEKTRAGQPYAGSTFTLTDDIDLGGVARRPIGTFNGVFDGNGHTISNLVINLPTTDDVGLFSILKNATIKNLSIRGGRIEGRHRVGGLAGRVNGDTVFEDCTTDLEVVAQGYDAGGLVGNINGAGNNRFTRCRTLGPVTGYYADERVGGLVGRSEGSFTADSCYSSGAITGYGTTGRVGGLLGHRYDYTVTFTNSYSVSRLQGNYLTQGGSTDDDIVGSGSWGTTEVQSRPTIIDELPKNIVNLAKRGNGSGTVSWSGSTPVAMPDHGSVFIRWDNAIPEGEFNEITLYAVFGKVVATGQDLRGLPAKGFFKQTADITMTTNVTFEGLHNSPRFQGEYDGAGFEIRGLTINLNADNAGLFRVTQGAVVRGVHLVGGSVKGNTAVGPLVGYQFAGLVEDCLSETDIQATGNHGGGLVGRIESYATVRRSAATGSVTVGGSYAGGLVSYMAGGTSRIEDSYARGDVKAANYCGGFIGGGADQFAIRDCYSAGVVTCSSTAGGFFARNDTGRTVTGCNWDSTKAGQTRSTYGTALSTADMKTAANFSSWDANVWKLVDGEYPELFAVIDTAERFTVTWENADGTTLAVQEEVRAGRVPQYQGTLPVKPVEGAKPSYFAGWSPKPTALTSNVTYRATFRESTARTWMTVDLATGRIGYADYDVPTATALFNTLEFKTTKMAFRRVAAGSDYYVQNGAYTAQMTNSYYIGVFEVTVAQFAMMQNGTKPASYVLADLKAQGSRNRSNTRGGTAPAAFGAGITDASPLGLFNARVRTANGDERLTFDLPTEAMWEVAARATASGDLVRRIWNWYFGEDESLLADHAFIANDTSPDDWGSTSGIRVPGSRLPNDWGLYDIYGNVRELCLDGANGESTPDYVQGNWTEAPGYVNGKQRTRGGGYDDESSRGRSSWRTYHDSGAYGHTGIRLARICSPDEEIVPEDDVIVSASITGDRDLKIPYSWFESFPSFAEDFDDDYTVAALMPTGKTAADGSPMSVWQDYVAGTDPTNPEDVFRATIEMVDGVPYVSWEPNLNTNETLRIYSILGKADLADPGEEWLRVRPGHRFFKVTVEMPSGSAVTDEPGPVDVGGD